MLGSQLESPLVGTRSKDDSVIAEHHFQDLVDTIGGTVLDFTRTNGAGGVGDIDGVFTHPLAELAQTTTGAARANNRSIELGEGGTKLFSDDTGKRQHGGRTGNLDGVAGHGGGRHAGDEGGGNRHA